MQIYDSAFTTDIYTLHITNHTSSYGESIFRLIIVAILGPYKTSAGIHTKKTDCI